MANKLPAWRCDMLKEALAEALALCLTPSGLPDLKGLAAAEDAYNRALAQRAVDATLAYHQRRLAVDPRNVTTAILCSRYVDLFKVVSSCCIPACNRSDAVDKIVAAARSPLFSATPRGDARVGRSYVEFGSGLFVFFSDSVTTPTSSTIFAAVGCSKLSLKVIVLP
jgi:hypothetical protein